MALRVLGTTTYQHNFRQWHQQLLAARGGPTPDYAITAGNLVVHVYDARPGVVSTTPGRALFSTADRLEF